MRVRPKCKPRIDVRLVDMHSVNLMLMSLELSGSQESIFRWW